MWNRRHRWLRRFAGTLAFAALVVPTAQAKVVHNAGIVADEQAEYNGYGYMHSSGVPLAEQGIIRPDDRAVKFSAQAGDTTLVVRPDDRAARFSPQAVDSTLVVRPDDRAVRFAPEPLGSRLVVRPDDRGTRFSPAGGDAPQLVADTSSKIDWTDAGIGAGMAVGLMLLGLGAGLATRHLSRKTLANA